MELLVDYLHMKQLLILDQTQPKLAKMQNVLDISGIKQDKKFILN